MKFDYVVGQRVRFRNLFTSDPEGELPADPTVVKLLLRRPKGQVVTVTSFPGHVDDSGEYVHEVTLDQGGVWRWRWEGTGSVETSVQGRLLVEEANVVESGG